jgi:glutaredoxin 3
MSEITVYTTEPCGYCGKVKALLKARGYEFAEVNLTKDPEGRAELSTKTGMTTFPQVMVGEELIGSFNETEAAVKSGRLDALPAAEADTARTHTSPAPPPAA